jgi:AcrR family transcriptional regulator
VRSRADRFGEVPACEARRGPYARTAARRREIIDAAATAFGESGYAAASIRDIAARLGVSHATITFHFGSKQKLLAAVLEHQQGQLREVLDRATQTPLDFLAFVVRLFDKRETTPGRAELFLTLAAESWPPDHPGHAYMVRHYARLRGVITDVFDELADRGLLRNNIDVAKAARFGVALTDGLQLQRLYAPTHTHVADDLASYFLQILNAKGRRALHARLEDETFASG